MMIDNSSPDHAKRSELVLTLFSFATNHGAHVILWATPEM